MMAICPNLCFMSLPKGCTSSCRVMANRGQGRVLVSQTRVPPTAQASAGLGDALACIPIPEPPPEQQVEPQGTYFTEKSTQNFKTWGKEPKRVMSTRCKKLKAWWWFQFLGDALPCMWNNKWASGCIAHCQGFHCLGCGGGEMPLLAVGALSLHGSKVPSEANVGPFHSWRRHCDWNRQKILASWIMEM